MFSQFWCRSYSPIKLMPFVHVFFLIFKILYLALYVGFEVCMSVLSAETDPHEGKRKVEAMWPIFRLHHQRSRYIYDLFYRRKAISRGLYLIYLCIIIIFTCINCIYRYSNDFWSIFLFTQGTNSYKLCEAK